MSRLSAKYLVYIFIFVFILCLQNPVFNHSKIYAAQGDESFDTNIVADRPCRDVMLLFVRGSGQNGGAGNPNNYDSSLESYEAETYYFFNSITGQLEANGYGELSVDRLTLQDFPGLYSPIGYEAIAVTGQWGIQDTKNLYNAKYNFDGSLFENSVRHGVMELTGFLKDHMLKCPNQIMIIGGYSQGAQVVGEALWDLKNNGYSTLLQQIDQVSLYGDPKFTGITDTGFFQAELKDWVRGDVRIGGGGVLGERIPYMPPELNGKVMSWCHHKDVVCHGLLGATPGLDTFGMHQKIHKESYVALSSVEIFTNLKDKFADMLGVNPGLRRSSSPIWEDYVPYALDVMLLFDRSSDMDKKYLAYTRLTNQLSFQMLEEVYPDVRAGLMAFNESNVGPGGAVVPYNSFYLDLVGNTVATKVTPSPIQKAIGQNTLQTFSGGAGDTIDSILGAIQEAIDAASWRQNARHVIVYQTNSYGRDPEPVTEVNSNSVINAALNSNIEILPVFYSETMMNNPAVSNEELISARNFHKKLANNTNGVFYEFNPYYSHDWELYDVIMGSAASIEFRLTDAGYSNVNDEITTLSTFIGEPLRLSVASSYDPDSPISSIRWDFNNDGVYDQEGNFAYYIYELPFQGNLTVEFITRDGVAAYRHIPVTVAELQTQSEFYTYLAPTKPYAVAERTDNGDIKVTWTSDLIDMHSNFFTILSTEESHIITLPSDAGETLITEVPNEILSLFIYTSGPNGESEHVEIPIQPIEDKASLDLTFTDPAGTDSSKVPLGESFGQAGPLPVVDTTPVVPTSTPQVAYTPAVASATDSEVTTVKGVQDTTTTNTQSNTTTPTANIAPTQLVVEGWFSWWWLVLALLAGLCGYVVFRWRAKHHN